MNNKRDDNTMKWISLYKFGRDGQRLGRPLGLTIVLADGFFSRLRGLLGTKGLAASEGLLMTRCSRVHTIGMRYTLDLVFLDQSCQVVKCCECVKPYRTAAARGAYYTLELSEGAIRRHDISVGDRVSIFQGAP
ncbi:MAG: DUF192 domain-containing protein [Candidatus Thiodiazotropha sp.]|jgi:uncharacterized protein